MTVLLLPEFRMCEDVTIGPQCLVMRGLQARDFGT